jgi:hypothetical protein
VPEPSKACICGFSIAGIAGSNPARHMDISFLSVLGVFRQKCLRRSDHSSRAVPPSVMCQNECDPEGVTVRMLWLTTVYCAGGGAGGGQCYRNSGLTF